MKYLSISVFLLFFSLLSFAQDSYDLNELFEPVWDTDMIEKGGMEQTDDERFVMIYDAIPAEVHKVFLTDLNGEVVQTFFDGSPEETGIMITFSFSKLPLSKGIYYLNVIADGKPREAKRVVVK